MVVVMLMVAAAADDSSLMLQDSGRARPSAMISRSAHKTHIYSETETPRERSRDFETQKWRVISIHRI
jgi:hypothetical protein